MNLGREDIAARFNRSRGSRAYYTFQEVNEFTLNAFRVWGELWQYQDWPSDSPEKQFWAWGKEFATELSAQVARDISSFADLIHAIKKVNQAQGQSVSLQQLLPKSKA